MKKLLVGAMALVLMTAYVSSRAQAQVFGSAGGLSVGVDVGSFLYKERTTEVRAGLTPLVTFSERRFGQQTAAWTGGFISFPSNESGLFPEFNYLHVDLLVLGVKGEDLRERRVRSDDPSVDIDNDGNIVVETAEMGPGLHYLVIDQDQKGSRRERRILFFIKMGSNILKTDQVALTFMVTDPTRFVEDYCQRYEGSNVQTASRGCLDLATSLYLEKEAGSIRLVSPRLPYNAAQETEWRSRQNLPRVLDPPQEDQPTEERRKLPPPTGRTNFSIQFEKDGRPYFVPGMRLRIIQGKEDQAYNLTSSSPEFSYNSGEYQFRFFIPGRGDSGWSTLRVFPGMRPVKIRIES